MSATYVTPKQRKKMLARIEKMRETEERIKAEASRRRQIDEACTCKSGRGKKKTGYESDERAVDAIRKMRDSYGGTYRVYRCPTSPRLHVATRKAD